MASASTFCIMFYFSTTFLVATRTAFLSLTARVTRFGPCVVFIKLMEFWAFSLGFFCRFSSKTLHLPPVDVEALSLSSIMIKYLVNKNNSSMSSSQSICLGPWRETLPVTLSSSMSTFYFSSPISLATFSSVFLSISS